MTVLIGKDGKLLWRGNPGRLPQIILDVEKKKYDQKKVIGDDDFNAFFTGMIVKSNYKGALALLEKELDRPGVNPKEIVSLQVGIHYRRLNSAENALGALHRAQKRFPLDPAYYEMELKLLELGHLEKKMDEFYFRLTNVFKNHPRVLLKFVAAELNRSFGQMNPAHIYTVARAAANAGKYSSKREKGRAVLYYAQSLYCLGRADLALQAAEESLKYLKGEKEYKRAEEVRNFYRKLADFSPKIRK
jgi:tetratricopeptide (TPR) repeat protein